MNARRLALHGAVTGIWALVIALTVGLLASLITGEGYRPWYLLWLLAGVGVGAGAALTGEQVSVKLPLLGLALALLVTALTLGHPFGQSLLATPLVSLGALIAAALLTVGVSSHTLGPVADDALNRYRVEASVARAVRGLGLLFFGLIVTVPLFLMISGSLYTTPSGAGHDFAALGGGAKATLDPFRAYYNLFAADAGAIASNFFGRYFLNSVWVSLLTVVLTLALAVPGAYAISRLTFPGQRLLSRSVLMIYLVPVIVLVIPLFVMLTNLGLRNAWGLLLVYPATTLPVALYMLQGYFRGLPAELEEAGLMDGCSRLRVIWSITIPLALPAIASVALYVFMIAWNEFLIAFMLLSDQASFTLPIGINSMNSSEVAEQDLMAAAVVATVPIVVLFLWAERFMVQGLTSGGVKG